MLKSLHMSCRVVLVSAGILYLSTAVSAQQPTSAPPATNVVTGHITNEKGELMAGITITEKGTKNFSQADSRGDFRIRIQGKEAILVFSAINVATKEVKVTAGQVVNVSLADKATELNDVVVIGYGTQRRQDLTVSVSSVNAGQIKDIPLSSAMQALQGRLAGVNISTTEGGPGAPVTIKVRGGGSITQDNTPLYVVDGIQVEDALSKIAPQDIESVDVLKDAAATSIYGARGANGVVIITTKGGKPMKTVVAYNYFYGINKLAKKFDVMNPKDFIEYNWEKTRNTLADSSAFTSQYGNNWGAGLDSIRNAPGVDWQDLTFGENAPTQTHNVSVTGGDRATTFNISYTNNNEKSVMINSNYLRNLLNVRLDHIVSDKFKVGLNFAYNDQVINGPGTSASGNVTNNRLRNSVKYRPFLVNSDDPNNSNDASYFEQTNATGYYLINPVQFSNASYRRNRAVSTTISSYLQYAFTKYLSLRVTGGINKNDGKLNVFDDYITWNAITNSSGKPIINIVNSNTTSITENAALTFNNSVFKSKFHKDNSITVLLGQEIYQASSLSQTDQVRYLPIGITPEKAFSQLSLGTSTPLYPASTDTKSRIVSFFTRVGYSHKNKYLATFNMRADGSSKFAPGNQWAYFPSASVAWRISNEEFFNKNSFASDVKLRLSYGLAGNNRINDFLYSSLYRSNATPYSLNNTLIPGYAINNLANKNLKWESTLSRNVGLDVSLFNNLFQVTLDAYLNDTRDLLINVPIAANSGFSTQLQNVGSVRNRGLELQLSTTAISKKNFKWAINFNISTNRNKIIGLSNVSNRYFASSGWGPGNDYLVQVGQPVGTIWGFESDGMYTLNDFDYNSSNGAYVLKKGVADNTASVGIPAPGTKKLKDLTGDGIVNADDRTILGTAQPKFTGGLNNQLTYKRFDLSVFVNFVYGNKILNGDKVEFSNAYAGSFSNLTAIMNDRWRTIDANGKAVQWAVSVNGKTLPAGAPPETLAEINKGANIWQPIKGGNYLLLDSWAVEDGSFLRFNNITLGYSLPVETLLKKKISAFRIYCTVNNAGILTKYTGLDPEVSTKNSSLVTPGVDSSPYPRSRTFIAGINVKF
ncbi:SusC/RagA family TonB-linked outer membrane protein [Chitinophaga sp. SYP-B3965]|uniref:SusC/RagA family TonB-linked outer membrane protein n=1 Tax=Chitinophaga sp. SYP-B3965 TaxID=2663120 RepID=UPI001299D41B|nr:TonB-dependent receptor [Chitinophaga sp. SYP-B3965]MRG48607.1 SusC/RagA family TonB-linked outer membrane protein [Chitinophaga sp. SYP-B3965]